MRPTNLLITLSNGKSIIYVAEYSTRPENGYFVQNVLLPLMLLNDSEEEISFLNKHCTLSERRINAMYRYQINLAIKKVKVFEEIYNSYCNIFLGNEITKRYLKYLTTLKYRENTKKLEDALTNHIEELLTKTEQRFIIHITKELKRIGRTVSINEFSETPFCDEVKDYIEAFKLNDEEKPICEVSFPNIKEKHLTSIICDSEMSAYDISVFIDKLQEIPAKKRKVYHLKGRNGVCDISFTIDALIPVLQSRRYEFSEIEKFIDNSKFKTDFNTPMGNEFEIMHEMLLPLGDEFFKIKGTELIVIATDYIYPTSLTEKGVKFLEI